MKPTKKKIEARLRKIVLDVDLDIKNVTTKTIRRDLEDHFELEEDALKGYSEFIKETLVTLLKRRQELQKIAMNEEASDEASDDEAEAEESDAEVAQGTGNLKINKAEKKKGKKPVLPIICVYTDGATPKNGREASEGGMGVYFEDNDEMNISEPYSDYYDDRPSNNKCELLAIGLALEKCQKTYEGRKIKVYTDSEYSYNCITKWAQKWRKNGWKKAKGGNVANVTLLERILDVLDDAHHKLNTYSFEHVRGHAGVHGNEEADRLANEAIGRKGERGIELNLDEPLKPKMVYAVYYGDHGCLGIYNTRSQAEAWIAEMGEDADVIEFEMNTSMRI